MYPNKRGRDRLYILAEILDIAKDGTMKTIIMYRANLSFTQLNEYLDLLASMRMIETFEVGGKRIYKTISKGLVYLNNYKQIIELLRSDGFGELGSERKIPIIERKRDEE